MMDWIASDDPKFTDVQQLAKDILDILGYGYVHYVYTLKEKGQYEILFGLVKDEAQLIVHWAELNHNRLTNRYADYVMNYATHLLGVSPRSNQHKNELVRIYSARLAKIETQLTALNAEKVDLQTKRANIKPYQTDDQL